MSPATQAVPLVPHPATPSVAARAILVEVRRAPRALALRYVLSGDVERLRIPRPRPPARADGLWRHTCLEVFVASGEGAGYEEFNFSPSGEWAAYAFTAYREGGAALQRPAPALSVNASAQTLELSAELACPAQTPLRLGLAAVVEDAAGALSFWALRHPAGRPDFHHAASFAMEIR